MSRRQDLYEQAAVVGLIVREYSPGDGVTRYRFFHRMQAPVNQSYFGPENGLYTALGLKEAEVFVAGFMVAGDES